MLNFIQSSILVGFILSGSTLYSSQALASATNIAAVTAMQTVSDPTSSPADFEAAMKQLDSVKGDASFWLRIASDKKLAVDRRQHCVKHYVTHFVSPGMRLGELVGMIGEGVDWISYDRIRKERRGDIGGWFPESLLKGACGFSIPVLSNSDGPYHLVIFLSLEADLRLDDLVAGLKGKATAGNIMHAVIADCRAWDSDDQEKKFPDSKAHQWPWR